MAAAEQGFDFEPAYTAGGWGAGIAWRVTGYAVEWTEEEWHEEEQEDGTTEYWYSEPEQVENREQVVAHMIGDDRDFTFDVDDLTPIEEDAYCGCCGQIGCAWG